MPRRHLNLNIIKILLKKISNIGIRSVCFTGGEPALHPQLDKIIDLLCEYKRNFNLVSNGYFFIEKILPLLDAKARKLFTGVCFSLDGAGPASHDLIRGKGSYDLVIRSIKAARNKSIAVSVKTILHKQNLNELFETAYLCASAGVAELGYIVLTPSPGLLKSGLIPSPEEISEAITYVKDKLMPSFRMKINIEGYSSGKLRMSLCNPAYGLSLDHLGNFIFCCNLSHPSAGNAPDKMGKEYLGNIMTDDLDDIIYRHYKLLAWFTEQMMNKKSGSLAAHSGNCLDCYNLFDKMKWMKKNDSPYNRNH